jgi:hypothetical protein
MDPSGKNWLYELMQHCNTHRQEGSDMYSKYSSLDMLAYSLMRRTGLSMGVPLKMAAAQHPHFSEWSDTEKTKIIFTECLIWIAHFSAGIQAVESDLQHVANNSLKLISGFYAELGYKPRRKFSGFAKPDTGIRQLAEYLLDSRFAPPVFFKKEFWDTGMRFSFLFAEGAAFACYCASGSSIAKHTAIISASLELLLRPPVPKVGKAGIKIMEAFIKSAGRPAHEAALYIERAKMASEPRQPYVPSLLCLAEKKLVLEFYLAAHTAISSAADAEWSNVSASICQLLGISEEEFCNSLFSTQSFIAEYGNKIAYINNTYLLNGLAINITRQAQASIRKNGGSIRRELQESRELVELLVKSQNQMLSKEEKDKVRAQAYDLLKTIPSLAIFMVPGGSILLPILLNILPREFLLPSSFLNQKEKKTTEEAENA